MTFSPNDDDRLWRDSQQDGWFRFSSPLRYVTLLIILLFLVIGLWYLFSSTHQSYNKTDIALIRADETPFKVKAKDQGVPGVQHQDKTVYGRIRGDQNEAVVEHILPDPETPLSHAKEDKAPLKMVEQYVPEELPLEKQETPKAAPSPETPAHLTSIEDLIEDQALHEKPKSDKNKAEGKTFIQLGSLENHDMAEAEWVRLSKKHKDILGDLNPIIQKVDLEGDQKTYYRLRTGPFEGVEKAKEVCASLKEKKVDCLVIP